MPSISEHRKRSSALGGRSFLTLGVGTTAADIVVVHLRVTVPADGHDLWRRGLPIDHCGCLRRIAGLGRTEPMTEPGMQARRVSRRRNDLGIVNIAKWLEGLNAQTRGPWRMQGLKKPVP